jgi:hypothetical protein
MKRFVWMIPFFFIAVSLYGCAAKYKIAASKLGARDIDNWCNLQFTFTNTQNHLDDLWIQILVLDDENNTVTEKRIYFNTTLPGQTNEQQSLINANCNRVRRVEITPNAGFVEPNLFCWAK